MNCDVGLANYQPEYNTAAKGNINPWAALQTNISTEYETGHFEPCSSVSGSVTNPFDPSDTGGTYTKCSGVYEGSSPKEGAETSDELCYAANDPHTGYDGPGSSFVGRRSPTARTTSCRTVTSTSTGHRTGRNGRRVRSRRASTRRARRIVAHHERPAVPAAVYPDRRRAERVNLPGRHTSGCAVPPAGSEVRHAESHGLLSVLDGGPLRRHVHDRVRRRELRLWASRTSERTRNTGRICSRSSATRSSRARSGTTPANRGSHRESFRGEHTGHIERSVDQANIQRRRA